MNSYQPEAYALEALKSSELVTVKNSSYISFKSKLASRKGIILYPGAKVSPESYAPLMRRLSENGYLTFIAKMPNDLATEAPNAADDIIDDYPSIEDWYIIGHSLGGLIASQYAYEHDFIKGLILLSSYPQEKHDLSRRALSVLSIAASEDSIIDVDRINSKKFLLPNHTIYKVIEGGNHANMAFYGNQRGDKPSSISSYEQMCIILDMIKKLIK